MHATFDSMVFDKQGQAVDPVDQRNTGDRLDHDLRREVIEELQWDPRVRANDIGVSAKDGVVTLTGWVDAFGQRWAAEQAAHRVRGVRAVANEIEVRLPISSERTDAEIATAAVCALEANAVLKAEDIHVTVSNGNITLRGIVDWTYQKHDAEQAVRDLWGVRGVTNLITTRA